MTIKIIKIKGTRLVEKIPVSLIVAIVVVVVDLVVIAAVSVEIEAVASAVIAEAVAVVSEAIVADSVVTAVVDTAAIEVIAVVDSAAIEIVAILIEDAEDLEEVIEIVDLIIRETVLVETNLPLTRKLHSMIKQFEIKMVRIPLHYFLWFLFFNKILNCSILFCCRETLEVLGEKEQTTF